MPKPPRPSASEVLRHNLLILVGLPSHIDPCILDHHRKLVILVCIRGTSSIQKRATGTATPGTSLPPGTDVSTMNGTGNWTWWTNATYQTTTPIVMTTEPYVYEPMCIVGSGPCDTCYQPIKIRPLRNASIPGKS